MELSKYNGILEARETLIDDMKTQYQTELYDCESRLKQTQDTAMQHLRHMKESHNNLSFSSNLNRTTRSMGGDENRG